MSYPLGGKYHVGPRREQGYAMFTGVLKSYLELRQDGEIAVMNEFLARLLGCGTQAVYDRLEGSAQPASSKAVPPRNMASPGRTSGTSPYSVITGQGRLMDNSFVPWTGLVCSKSIPSCFEQRTPTGNRAIRSGCPCARTSVSSPVPYKPKTSAGGFCYAPKPERTVLVKE